MNFQNATTEATDLTQGIKDVHWQRASQELLSGLLTASDTPENLLHEFGQKYLVRRAEGMPPEDALEECIRRPLDVLARSIDSLEASSALILATRKPSLEFVMTFLTAFNVLLQKDEEKPNEVSIKIGKSLWDDWTKH